MQRVIALTGANNFRDMGGYPAAGGKTVRWGMLYRADHFAKLTDGDLATLDGLGIRTIIDLRSDAERAQYPDRLTAPNVVTLDPASAMAEASAEAWTGAAPRDETAFLLDYAKHLGGTITPENNPVYAMYRKLVTEPAAIEAYRTMLAVLSKPDAPAAVLHCRGGKDRTGYGAAVLLYLLGAPMECIVEDYLLTGVLREKRNAEKLAEYKTVTSDPNLLDFLMSLLDTRQEFIESSFAQMRDMAGSVDGYMQTVLGVTPALVDALRGQYLE